MTKHIEDAAGSHDWQFILREYQNCLKLALTDPTSNENLLQDCLAIAVVAMQDRTQRGEFDSQIVYPEICRFLNEFGPPSQKLDADRFGLIIRNVNTLAWNHVHSGDFTDGQTPSTFFVFKFLFNVQTLILIDHHSKFVSSSIYKTNLAINQAVSLLQALKSGLLKSMGVHHAPAVEELMRSQSEFTQPLFSTHLLWVAAVHFSILFVNYFKFIDARKFIWIIFASK